MVLPVSGCRCHRGRGGPQGPAGCSHRLCGSTTPGHPPGLGVTPSCPSSPGPLLCTLAHAVEHTSPVGQSVRCCCGVAPRGPPPQLSRLISETRLGPCLPTVFTGTVLLLMHRLLLLSGEGKGTPLQYSCLENPMDRGAWWAAVCGVTEGWTQLGPPSTHTRILCRGSKGIISTQYFKLL